MDIKMVNDITSLILERTVGGMDLYDEQRNTLRIEKAEISDTNKYFVFCAGEKREKSNSLNVLPLSVMFWELTHTFPIECIMFIKDGYIHSLEIYSCDGSPFEEIDLDNIDIRASEPSLKIAVED